MIIIDDGLEKKLRKAYEDCLELESYNDLTEFGKGELRVLREILFS